jgi:hypothetical protein
MLRRTFALGHQRLLASKVENGVIPLSGVTAVDKLYEHRDHLVQLSQPLLDHRRRCFATARHNVEPRGALDV